MSSSTVLLRKIILAGHWLPGLSFVVAGEPEPKLVDRETGEVKKDGEGRDLYTMPLLPKPNDDRRNPVIMVTFPAAGFPETPGPQQPRIGLRFGVAAVSKPVSTKAPSKIGRGL